MESKSYNFDILSVNDVMEELHVGKNYVYKLLDSGALKGFRIGKSWRITRECLDDFINSQIANNNASDLIRRYEEKIKDSKESSDKEIFSPIFFMNETL